MAQVPFVVRTPTQDGLYLHGFYAPGLLSRPAVLHIHDFEGNFYENLFVDTFAKKIPEAGFGFLSVNTRGNGKETDFLTVTGEYKTIGARFELLEEAYLDIDAWITYLLDSGYEDIILCGHSLGTMKAVRYLFEGQHRNKVKKLILLAPFDKVGLLSTYTPAPVEELLKKAQRKVDEGYGNELITKEYESIVVSYKTYISWYKQDDYGRVFEFSNPQYTFPILRKIAQSTKIVVGSLDEYFHATNPKNPEEALDILTRHIINSDGTIIKGSGHGFLGHEEQLVEEVVAFLQK